MGVPNDNYCGGHWTGEKGNSRFIPTKVGVHQQIDKDSRYQDKNQDKELADTLFDKYRIYKDGIEYKKGEPNFDKVSVFTEKIPQEKLEKMTGNFNHNVPTMHKVLAEGMNRENYLGKNDWTPEKVKDYVSKNWFQLHETSDGRIQLIHSYIHDTFKHSGLRAEIRKRENEAKKFSQQNNVVEIKQCEKNSQFNPLPIIVILAITILIVIFILCLQFCKIKPQPQTNALEEVNTETVVKSPTTDDKTEQKSESSKPISRKEEISFSQYKVNPLDTFYKIAEREYSNRHLWFFIYDFNKAGHNNPDLIELNDVIKLPSLPSNKMQQKEFIENHKEIIEESAFNAYVAYKKNKNTYRAVRTLASGEIVLQGFLSNIKNKIPEEELKQAEESVALTKRNQKKMNKPQLDCKNCKIIVRL